MRTVPRIVLPALFLVAFAGQSLAADDYRIDPIHSSVSFKILHMGLSYVHGRFNDLSGEFSIDPDDASKSSFTVTVKTASIDTNQKARDNHLRGPDFFNAKQFPTLTFKSTAVKAIDGGYEVTGDLTMHGTTKSITFPLKGGKTAQFMGMQRTGFSADLTVKRSEYGMDKFLGDNGVSDEVQIAVGFEGVKK